MKNFQRHAEPYLGKAAVIEKKTISHNVETHWHSFYEFEFIVGGECEFVINGKIYGGKMGDMFIFNLSDFHNIRLKSDKLEVYTLQFVIDYINDTLLSYLLHNEAKKLTFKGESLETITYLLELFTKEFQKSRTFHQEYAKSLLNAIMVNTCRQLEKITETPAEAANNPIKLAANYMQLNFQENITIADVADYAGVTQAYLSKLFVKHMSMGPKQYLTRLRLDYATKMLEFSDQSITEICYLSGFGDFSVFWRAFTNRYGCSPRDYMHKHLKQR